MTGDIVETTVVSIITEVTNSSWAGVPAKTIFFGGGTPTFLDQDQLLRIFDAVIETHPPIEGAEITSEANPGTVDQAKFAAMKRAGFNRISLGAQSFQPNELLRLGRVHQADDVGRAVAAAREAGFSNINLDLMFALPNQNITVWQQNLKKAISLNPTHLSLYCLTIEQNTAFYKQNLKGLLELPDEDCQVAMYEYALEATAGAGYLQYEISNFSKPELACKHNLSYWQCEDYAGYGPGAVGCMEGVRYTNWKQPERYSEVARSAKIGSDLSFPLAFETESLSESSRKIERIMLGIRLNQGIELQELDQVAVQKTIQKGWCEATDGYLRLTAEGRHFCTEVSLALI